MVKKNIITAISLFGLGILTRIPFMSNVFYYWDCVNYALALDHFDISQGRPAAPGYFLYIMLGRIMRYIVGDPNACFVWLSMIATGLGAVTLFFLGLRMFSYRSGIGGAVLFLSSPLVWFHGEIAFAYMLEGSLSVGLALVSWYALQNPKLRHGLFGACLLALLGGLRPQGMVLLLPLWLYGIHRLSRRDIIISVGCFGFVCMGWMGPMVWLSGGLQASLQAFQTQGSFLVAHGWTAFWGSMAENLEKYFRYLLKALTLGIVILVCGIPLLFKKRKSLFVSYPAKLLLIWIGVPSLFFIGVYLGNPGHFFTCLFAFFLLVSLVLDILFKGSCIKWGAVLTVCVALNCVIFLSGSDSGSGRIKRTWYQAAEIRQKNQFVGNKVKYIQQNFQPQDTIILAETGGSGHLPQVSYYLPEFQSYHFARLNNPADRGVIFSKTDRTLGRENYNSDFLLSPLIKHIILFDLEYVKSYSQDSRLLRKVVLEDGVSLDVLDCEGFDTLMVHKKELRLLNNNLLRRQM